MSLCSCSSWLLQGLCFRSVGTGKACRNSSDRTPRIWKTRCPKGTISQSQQSRMPSRMIIWSVLRSMHSDKKVGHPKLPKMVKIRNPVVKSYSNRCTPASGLVGFQGSYMRLPHLLAVSCLSAATICGGRKGKENTQSVKACAADVRLVDRIILIKHRF